MLSFLYLGLRQVFEFLILLARSADRKELSRRCQRKSVFGPALAPGAGTGAGQA